ncbi:MAG TPA: GNAT family N-acetyltransferase [Polyangia bacterium]|nr:GNAT family N-acetyltransferase [Polyangia bacterium]
MITFERLDGANDALLGNLYQLYIHDMSEWLGLELGADGRFAFDTGALWRDGAAVFLARSGGAPAGFGVVQSAAPWLGAGAARDVKDFFVLRRYRRRGVGRALARHLWDAFPGPWLVRVLAANAPALPFWRRAVQEIDGAHTETAVAVRGRDWIHLRFDAR